MRTVLWTITLWIVGLAAIASASASVIDAPHNQTNNIVCSNCHSYTLWWQQASSAQAQSPEKTAVVNAVCMHCHGADGDAPMTQSHSAAVMGSDYHDGNWGVGCTVCHNPHLQEQLSWLGSSPSPLLLTGTITGVTANSPQENQTTITYADAGSNADWPAVGDTADALEWARKNASGRGLILVHDASRADNTFIIVSANSTQIVVKGILDPDSADPAHPGNLPSCNTFGLLYGQLVRSQITTPFSGAKDVKFFTPLGGFVNQEEPASGVCQVCHTETAHFRNTGETNVDSTGLDHTPQAGVPCIDCHAHGEGFAHGLGGATTVGCGMVNECHGAQGSHPPHLNTEGMVQGTCALCHDTTNFPTFADGQTTIAATSVCDPCHHDGKGSPVDTPAWGAASPPQCTECHAAVPATGSHGKHLANSWISCGNCHHATVQSSTPPAQHLDHNIDVYHTTPGDLGYPADKGINSAAATCSVPACHGSGAPLWGGTVGCESCHLAASDFGDYTFGNLVIAQISGNEWSSSGHGKATGSYEVSGNPAANLSEAAGSASPCLYCHDPAVGHGAASNPFRLANANADGNGANDTCLVCHGTAGSGYDADGGGAMAQKSATIKVDKYHYGSAHGASNNGGSLCWDCHDPHGDRVSGNGNIYMVHSAVVKEKADAYGTPAVTVSPLFTANATGADYAMDASPHSGICQVCHGATAYYTSSAGANGHFTDRCTNCHLHGSGTVDQYAFNHGGGSGDASVCQQCHGHDAGYGGLTGGKGSYATHSTHTEDDTDDARGPFIGCDGCHNTASMPDFKDGVSYLAYTSGAATSVCNPCHSDQGSYDGVNDPVIGARNNWQSGVYEADGSLKAGKERWCASCHDEVPSVIGGIAAPNMIGDESGAYTYGTGWGFYKTGHGLGSGEAYPYKGGLMEPSLVNGATRPVTCDSCHDFSTAHIDGNARTYNDGDSSSTDPSIYRQAYRLDLVPVSQGTGVSGREPLLVPWSTNTSNVFNNSRLCFNCHDSGPFINSADMDTNLVTAGVNRHEYHMVMNSYQYPADWDGVNTSRITCVVCHNVHGSTRLAMVRDGRLTGRAPGVEIWYKNDAITTNIGTTNPPVPADLTLAASDGTAWISNTVHNLCVGCHNSGILEGKDRAPFQDTDQVPTLDWTGEADYVTDGAGPDSAPSDSTFTFRVKYTDSNNDAPASINLLIDTNNDGTVDDTYPITGADAGDVNYMNGVIYSKSLVLTDVFGSTIGYKFEASDGTDAATGAPLNWSTVYLTGLLNHAPELAWVSDTCRYQGVSPASAVSGADFDFYVNYTDANDQFDSLQVWIDLNDDGDYDDTDEKQDMVVDGGDGDYSNGENFTKTVTLSYAGDGMLNYRFVASDGTYAAGGDPINVQSVTIIDSGLTPVTVCAAGCDQTSIQAGIDAALSGDKITLVSPGTYNENISLWNSSYTNSVVRSVCGPDETTISSTGDIVFLQNVTGILIDGFEITGGTRGVNSNAGAATINNCKIHDNNNAGATGGGLNSGNAAGILTVTNSEIYLNTSFGNGGGASYGAGAGHSFTNTIIRDNESTNGAGGAVFTQNGSVTFTDVTMKNNTASGVGGAVYANSSDTTFSRCTITGNTSTGGAGGALYNSTSGCDAVFENCIIADNKATNAGVTFVNQGTLSIINSTLAYNQATSGDGGAIKTNTGSTTIRNSILWGNSASGAGHIAYNTGAMTITDTVIASGSDGVPANAPYFAGSVTPTVSGYISENDPLFVDSTNNNYHIKLTSDAIDNASASYAPDKDIDGDTRPQGAADDIGADEYRATLNAPELSWTGETGYTVSGVDPDSDTGGSTFTFRIDYTDADNNEPTTTQVWIDQDDNGAFSSNEKYDMTGTDGNDTDYTDGKRYAKAVVLAYAGDGDLAFRFYASDGIFGATGDPASKSTLTVTNNVPTLAWTGETNYTADGVNPDSGTGSDTFTFRVDYTDADNTAPSVIQIWVDEDDSGLYEADERHDMTAVDGGDTDYTDGRRYSTDLTLLFRGDGNLNYRFYATDSSNSATGNPTSDAMVSVANSVPTLTWTGEANYTTDGVDPDSAAGGSTFTFHVDYTDADNTAPSSIQIWVDEDDSGAYEADEKHDMTAVNSGDTDYTDVKRYTTDMALSYTGDGAYPYRFHAIDGAIAATGDPTAARTVTVTFMPNEAPTLDWTGETGYTTDGVDPESDLAASTFTFRVKYSDSNNDSPTSIQVWIDEDDSSSYEEGEKYNLTAVDTGDTLYTDGKLYTVDRAVGFAGDGVLHYRFHANDGEADATANDPVTTTSATLSVINPITVCASGADFTTIQGAISDAGTVDGDYIRVCDGTYSENINFNGKNVIVYSMNGAAAATIQGSGANSPVLTFSSGETASAVVDGFTIDNQNSGGASAYGIKITSSSAPAIKNSMIKGNVPASYVNGAAIYIDGGGATIENCTIGDPTDVNQGRYGSAIYAINGGADLTVTGSTLLANVAANDGGAIYLSARTSLTTLTDTTVSDSSAGQNGGAIRCINSALVLNNSTIDSNTAIASYSVGGGIHISGALATLTTTSGTTISNNDANTSGGIHASGGAQLIISGAIIEGNIARGGTGGGLNISDEATVVDISKTWIRGNTTKTYGGGIYNNTATTTLTNCMVTGNLAEGVTYNDGGGISNAGAMNVYSSTIVGNRTGRNGGGWSGGGTITNSIFWGNSAGGTGAQINGSPTVTYSDVAGGFTGTGNIDSDPYFVDLQVASAGTPTTAGNFHICNNVDDPLAGCTGNSAAIDAGTSTDSPTDDFDGDSRPLSSGIDMGADEYRP